MVELKIMEKTELVAKKLRGHGMIGEGIFEVPPKEAVKLTDRGVARTASWSDFENEGE